jgi:DNA-binding SARP family transcriptional activator
VDFEPLLAAKPESLSRAEVQTLLSRYTGDLFAQDRYADWSAAAREQLTERYIALLLMEGHAALQANQPQTALDACKQALQKDPWREDAVLLGMQAAYAMHNRPAALRLYAALEASLRDELHIQPRQDVRAFAAQLRAEA